jgi:hypothetical protein
MNAGERRAADSARVGQHTTLAVLILILLLATGLRLHRLDAQSFWNDEGNSARIAERSLRLILEGAEGDIHPPGYYILLHYWRALVGHSEYALRALSALSGIGLVTFTYLLGSQAFSRATGLGAAFLAALAPLGVYYAQEARMYALLGLLAAASTWMLLKVLAAGSGGSLSRGATAPPSNCGAAAAYALTSTAGLYVHYAFALVLVAHNAAFAVWWVAKLRRSPSRWRWLLIWASAMVGIILLYLPWLPVAWRSVVGWSSAGAGYAPAAALVDVLRVLTVGITIRAGEAVVALAGLGLALSIGVAPRRSDRLDWFAAAASSVSLFIPVGLILALNLYKPAWLKLLVVGLSPAHVLVAHGVENLAYLAGKQWPRMSSTLAWGVRLAGAGLAAVAIGPSLANLYYDPNYARDDYRQIAADIAADLRPGDGIVLSAPNQWEVFTYYYPDQDVHPAPYRPVESEAVSFVGRVVGRHDRLFALYWGGEESDPQNHIEAGLAALAYKTADLWYGRVRLATYVVSSLPDEPFVDAGAEFGGQIRLLGHALAEGDPLAAGALPVTLFWQATGPVSQRYKASLQLLDASGQLVAQHDSEPVGGTTPTTAWVAGQTVIDRHGLPVPRGLASGRYALTVVLYSTADASRLPVTVGRQETGDHFTLQPIEFRP